MKRMQWKGDGVLGYLARKEVDKKDEGHDLSFMAKPAQLAVGNAALCKDIEEECRRFGEVVGSLRGKCKCLIGGSALHRCSLA